MDVGLHEKRMARASQCHTNHLFLHRECVFQIKALDRSPLRFGSVGSRSRPRRQPNLSIGCWRHDTASGEALLTRESSPQPRLSAHHQTCVKQRKGGSRYPKDWFMTQSSLPEKK